jgi:hypothetical protein
MPHSVAVGYHKPEDLDLNDRELKTEAGSRTLHSNI